MIFLQGLWHVAYLSLLPHSFPHTLTYILAKVSKQTKLYNYQLWPSSHPCLPPAITAAASLGNSWCLWPWLEQISTSYLSWYYYSKSCRGTFQTCSLLRISLRKKSVHRIQKGKPIKCRWEHSHPMYTGVYGTPRWSRASLLTTRNRLDSSATKVAVNISQGCSSSRAQGRLAIPQPKEASSCNGLIRFDRHSVLAHQSPYMHQLWQNENYTHRP